jgi:hypothetical protein
MAPENPGEPPISDLERTRRIEAVDYARGMSELSGVTLSPEIEQLNQQYITGLCETAPKWDPTKNRFKPLI